MATLSPNDFEIAAIEPQNKEFLDMTKVLTGLGILIFTVSISFGQKQEYRERKVREPESKQFDLASDARLDAQLQSSVDVKNAKVGDQIIFKTTKALKQNGETVIHKDSTVYGRITEVRQRATGNAVSRLGIIFDRIEGKEFSAPIKASIVSITNVAGQAAVGDLFGSEVAGSSQTSSRTSSGPGGLLGSVGNTVGGVGSTVGGVVDTTTQTVGNVAGSAVNTVGGTAGVVGQTVGGLQISNSASASANGSSTISSSDKNVRLQKGLVFRLNVISNAQAN